MYCGNIFYCKFIRNNLLYWSCIITLSYWEFWLYLMIKRLSYLIQDIPWFVLIHFVMCWMYVTHVTQWSVRYQSWVRYHGWVHAGIMWMCSHREPWHTRCCNGSWGREGGEWVMRISKDWSHCRRSADWIEGWSMPGKKARCSSEKEEDVHRKKKKHLLSEV